MNIKVKSITQLVFINTNLFEINAGCATVIETQWQPYDTNRIKSTKLLSVKESADNELTASV